MIISDKNKIDQLLRLASQIMNLKNEFPDNPFLRGNFKDNCLFTEYDNVLNGDFFYKELIGLCRSTDNEDFFFISLDRAYFEEFTVISFNANHSYDSIRRVVHDNNFVDNFIIFPTNLQWAIWGETCFGVAVISVSNSGMIADLKNISNENLFYKNKIEVADFLDYLGLEKNYSSKFIKNFFPDVHAYMP